MALRAQYLCMLIVMSAKGIEIPGTCKRDEYFEPGSLSCQSCPGNASLVPTEDGFGCTCKEHTIPSGVAQCKPCQTTEVVSSDGRACVKRKCQNTAGRIVCRKCPSDYISVTQNFDGSPMKEVLCVKCARGYRAELDSCIRCESCACPRNEAIVHGRCVPKRFVNERPKHDEVKIHPDVLLDVVKYEYLCTQNDFSSCRFLASLCVRHLYDTDPAGPCRLWIQPKLTPPKRLPSLIVESTSYDNNLGEITLTRGTDILVLAVAEHEFSGGLKMLTDPERRSLPCVLPLKITVGFDYSNDCHLNISELDESLANSTFAPFLYLNEDFKPIPVTLRKPNGNYLQKGSWPTSKFRRYFIIHKYLSITSNVTNIVYLRTLLIKLQIQRDKTVANALQLTISIEAQYASKSPLSRTVTTTLKVTHDLPSAGVLRGLEIWGGVLGAFLSLYALVQWRGNIRRGGFQYSLVPLLSGTVADALYFAAFFSTLHALAAEAGTLGMTLPLSKPEENMIKVFIFSAVSLKAIKLTWINWNQCRCDMFFLDWTEYYPPVKATLVMGPCCSVSKIHLLYSRFQISEKRNWLLLMKLYNLLQRPTDSLEFGLSILWRTIELPVSDNANNWRAAALAREWGLMQAKRRACPGYTATLALVVLHLLTPWYSHLPQSVGYKWTVATLAWWSAYVIVVTSRWIADRLLGSPTEVLPKVCQGVGMSLLVFQEELYAHYLHGRNDDSDPRSMAGPLSACRIVCARQLRAVYKQLSTPGLVNIGGGNTKQTMLSRFLAAFFERALDGLSWVASERTILERLLDVELVAREAGNTSTLLHDSGASTPSCFLLTWWGEEWTLGTFDAMLFGAVFVSIGNSLYAALITVAVWQVMKHTRTWFGNKNQTEKTAVQPT